VIASIETAVAHLGEALAELDRLPPADASTVGFAAHVLNNYLNVSDATLELLAVTLRDHPDPDVGRWVAGLRHLDNLMHHTVSRLFSAALPEVMPLKVEPFDLTRLMQRACAYYQPAAVHKQIDIVCHAAGAIPLARADSVAAAVIADNLLSNALKFSPPGGTILVEILSGPGGVVCSVRDQGAGLTPAEQQQLFLRSMRNGPAPTGGEPSHGFGLSIVKNLVERMDGRVWYEGGPGQGSCFSFSLPYVSTSRPAE
jgi:signal transduction histidine kinase